MEKKIIIELDHYGGESAFFMDLLEVTAVRLKNHIAELRIWLTENERLISKTERVKETKPFLVLYNPDQRLFDLKKERKQLENQLYSCLDNLEAVKKIFKQSQTQILATINKNFDESKFRKVFEPAGQYPAIWGGYKSYHYRGV
jgi:hypothetical protein